MQITTFNTALRKIILLVVAMATVSTLFHIFVLSQRYSRHKNIKKIHRIEPNFNTPATIPDEYLENHPNISRHDFEYIFNPQDGELCQNGQSSSGDLLAPGQKRSRRLLILFMVHSKAEHFQYRKTIRETWGSVGKRLTQVVFLLGNPLNDTTQRRVEEESRIYGDIIQEDFQETYRNITLKNIMGLKWASQYCPHVRYVVKSDDDMFVNTKMLISTLINSELPKKDLLLCKIHFFKNVPREGKYIIDKSLYSADYWPSFCFGGCWIASIDAVRNLYRMSLQTRQIYLDDVYVTGILRTKLSLPLKYLSRAYMIFCHARGNYDLVREMWEALQASKEQSRNISSLQAINEPYVKSWALCFK